MGLAAGYPGTPLLGPGAPWLSWRTALRRWASSANMGVLGPLGRVRPTLVLSTSRTLGRHTLHSLPALEKALRQRLTHQALSGLGQM